MERSRDLLVPRCLGPQQTLQTWIRGRWLIQQVSEAFELSLRENKIPAIKQDGLCLLAGCIEHEIRTITAKSACRPVYQHLLAAGNAKIDVFDAEFARCSQRAHF